MFDGEYLGTVVFNEDPLFAGRCKIKIVCLFEDLTIEQLPWIYPQTSSVFSSAYGAGSISVPKIGSIVRVKFHGGDIYSGEYTNIQNIDPALIEEIKNDYQGTHILAFDSEKNLVVGYQPMMGFKIWLDGSMVKVDANGSIQLKHKNNSNVVELNDNKINITTVSSEGSNMNGEINISAGATVNITAPVVNVNSPSISLGNKPSDKAVKADKLIKHLKNIVSVLASKNPQGAGDLTGQSFKDICSDTVYIN